jgi:riboflavin kinase/FMN adenylyltransferase
VCSSDLTDGNFDGVHRGHASLIGSVIERAKKNRCQSVIITFEPHTRSVVSSESPQPVLSTFDEKAKLIADLGPDHLVCIAFDDAFRSLTPEQFVHDVLIARLSAKAWLLGPSHTFGKDRAGNRNSLQEIMGRYDIDIFTLDLLTDSDTPISSTEIRALVSKGELASATKWLGHPYLVAGRRVEGQKVGRTLGFPTLNFDSQAPEKVLPPAGVFAAVLEYGGTRWHGALYFCECPTFDNRRVRFEFNILEYTGDEGLPQLGETGYLWINRFMREDRTFPSPEALVEQIKKDVTAIHRFFIEEQ